MEVSRGYSYEPFLPKALGISLESENPSLKYWILPRPFQHCSEPQLRKTWISGTRLAYGRGECILESTVILVGFSARCWPHWHPPLHLLRALGCLGVPGGSLWSYPSTKHPVVQHDTDWDKRPLHLPAGGLLPTSPELACQQKWSIEMCHPVASWPTLFLTPTLHPQP